jgi:hypothetical protein
MFALPNTQHSQIAYVTNDLDAAAALLEKRYGIPGFYKFDTRGVAQPGDPQLRIALARVGGVEIELIEPQGTTATLFSELLACGGAELAIKFHHVAIRIDGALDNWEQHRAAIDVSQHPVVYQGGLGDMLRYFYTDERAVLGHYVEHVWMSPDLLAQLAGAIPTYAP